MAKPNEKIQEPGVEPVAEAPKPQIVAQTPKTKRTLAITRLQLAGALHNRWDVTAERGATIYDVVEPDYWKHVASKFQPLDQIEVLAEDGTWFARLLVVSSDRLWARVFKLEFHDLTISYEDMPKTQEEEYDIVWTIIGKYAVHKKGNQGLPALKDGFQTKLEAYQWLDGHLKTING